MPDFIQTDDPAEEDELVLNLLEEKGYLKALQPAMVRHQKAAAMPARSVLFNIEQKFDGIGGNQGSVAQFEHDLDKQGRFQDFQETCQPFNGRSWENDRDAVATVTRRSFARAYADLFGGGEDDAAKVNNDAKDSYREEDVSRPGGHRGGGDWLDGALPLEPDHHQRRA